MSMKVSSCAHTCLHCWHQLHACRALHQNAAASSLLCYVHLIVPEDTTCLCMMPALLNAWGLHPASAPPAGPSLQLLAKQFPVLQ